LTGKKASRYDFQCHDGKKWPLEKRLTETQYSWLLGMDKGVYMKEALEGSKPKLQPEIGETEKIPLESLSQLTGFPIEFIKKELLLDNEELSMEDLRSSMLNYLESTSTELNS